MKPTGGTDLREHHWVEKGKKVRHRSTSDTKRLIKGN